MIQYSVINTHQPNVMTVSVIEIMLKKLLHLNKLRIGTGTTKKDKGNHDQVQNINMILFHNPERDQPSIKGMLNLVSSQV